jgi:hypothetical protein
MWQFMPGNRSAWSGTIPPVTVTVKGKTFVPGQGNNAYIFPGSGLRAVGSEAKRVTDDMYFAAAKTLANPASEEDLAEGRIYPGPGRIREVSAANAAVVAGVAFQRGSTTMKRPADLSAWQGADVRPDMRGGRVARQQDPSEAEDAASAVVYRGVLVTRGVRKRGCKAFAPAPPVGCFLRVWKSYLIQPCAFMISTCFFS